MFNLLSIMGSPATSQPVTNIPFYLEDVSGSTNTVSIMKNKASAPTLTIETSADGQTWSTLGSTSTTALDITVPANGRVYVRCSATQWAINYSRYNFFSTATGNFKVGGNAMSLLYGSDFTGEETTFPDATKTFIFNKLFYNNTLLTDASDLLLPATTLVDSCYYDMFNGCTNLTQAPALPATTLTSSCYLSMFGGCTNLTQAPVLPATTLVDYCYRNMFDGCASLNTVTCLAEDISANSCTTSWLNAVASTGTFTKSSNMSGWPTNSNGIPSGWTVINV